MSAQKPSVGVVVPVRNSQRTIKHCISSLLKQDYEGTLTVWVVGNSEDQDTTWGALAEYADDPRVHCIKVSRPVNWLGRDANLKRFHGCRAAFEANMQVIALVDSQIFMPTDWLSKAIKLMTERQVSGIAGISLKHPEDRSLSGAYQEGSLVSEWPRYGLEFHLSKESFGDARGLPTTANLVISREVFERVRDIWPILCSHGWEDFTLVWRIVSNDFTILCTDKLYVYRNHKRKFRFVKQFSAGAGAYMFHQENPECKYTIRLMHKAALAVILLVVTLLVGLFSLFAVGFIALVGLTLTLVTVTVPMSITCIIKSRDWRGFLFPFLDALHVYIWITGVIYLARRKGRMNPAVADFLLQFR